MSAIKGRLEVKEETSSCFRVVSRDFFEFGYLDTLLELNIVPPFMLRLGRMSILLNPWGVIDIQDEVYSDFISLKTQGNSGVVSWYSNVLFMLHGIVSNRM